MEEKRKSPRIKMNAVASFKVQDTRLADGSRVKDISASGVCFPSKHYFPVGTILQLEIRSDDLMEPIKTLAKVVRISNRIADKFPFDVGIEFIDLPVSKQKMLQGYIQRTKDQGGNKDIPWID